MKKRIIAILVIAAFAAAGVAIGAVATVHRNAQREQTPKETDAVTYETPTVSPESTEPETEPETGSDEPEQPEFIWPDESYIGTWYNEDKTDGITILEITDNSIEFRSQIYRTLSVHATAMEINGEILFGEDIAPCSSFPTNKVSGKLIFEEDCVTIIYADTFEPPLDYMNGLEVWTTSKCTIFEKSDAYEHPEG